CYGCGSMNQHGLHIKSYWDGENTICHFMPKPYHTAFPGYVYGGLIASIMDCHAIGSAAAALYKAEGRIMGSMPSIRCVTASLKVEFLKPTPIDCELTVRGVIREVKTKKVILDLSLEAMKLIRAKAEIIAVRIPENYTV
ncbi:MAG: PaaI family thioesterase, partial [Spirochaetota bacterium]|nr:PaaI family thioesterase [Spirochaetota bacterium]